MKRIVIFYSLDGNTKKAAQTIAKSIHADIYEIEPANPIPRKGIRKFMIGGMQSSFGLCPKLKETELNLGHYDQIILGTPVWAGKCAAPVWSFIRKTGVDEKVVAVFTFSGSGNNGSCIRQLKKHLHHIQTTVSLTDNDNSQSFDNALKLQKFMKKF